ncbi:hypothetical protein AC579_1227 [Pseudocercospora musae]|uniref:PHD-type domain-containing protein n=1 Tax=Pseudocercospora musae TaxID=113226 RepID=A0A139I5J3_9PEZI|nr:hypothetical protein AC579_1227 [Pseudocercospora musae]
MPRYKRTREDAELDLPVEPEPEPALPEEHKETLAKLRNMWQFASLMQYIFLFGHVVKIDEDFDIEDLEAECLRPTPSEKLARIGLQLLKYVSSHRGLTPDIFDEYTRRQYLAKAPQRNPFGDEEEPVPFNHLDIYTRIQVLQQLSTWTLGNAERIRGMMTQDENHTGWRMEPLGWDKEDRAYYVLDDNRLYRRADEPIPPPTPKVKAKNKAKSKAKKSAPRKGTRASKRRKIDDSEDDEPEATPEADDTAIEDTEMVNGTSEIVTEDEPGYGFTSKTWECVAVTLEEYQDFMAGIFRSRDPNERQLRKAIEEDVLPIIEKRAEALRQKQLKKVRELENLQKMATAKRSSRLADKADKEAKEREEREAEEKRQRDLKMARDEQDRQKRIEEGHESRRLTREQRVREREAKRILHEEELAKLEDEAERAESQGPNENPTEDTKRASGRQRENQREQHKKELERLAEEDGNWYFDCSVCGQHGENMDDGSHSIACDRCNVWQHSKCHGFTPKQAEQDDFVFICSTCKRKEEDAKKPKIPPLKLHNRTSASPETHKASSRPSTANGKFGNGAEPHLARPQQYPASPGAGQFAYGSSSLGFQAHPNGQPPPSTYMLPPVSNFAPRPPQNQPQQSPQHWQGKPPPIHGYQSSPSANGYAGQAHAGHQQQHQYAHQAAVASSGGHPQQHHQHYAQPTPYQASGYSARAPGTVHPAPQHQHYQPQYSPQHQKQLPQYHSQHLHPHAVAHGQVSQGSSQLANGFQSPVKAAPKFASSPPPQQHPQVARTPQAPSSYPPQQQPYHQQHQQHLQQSPRTNLPPPAPRSSAHSPVKSSPPPQPPALYPRSSPSQHPPQLARTPQQSFEAPLANGHHPGAQVHTPQMHPPSSHAAQGASPNGTHVAADGMSGPWPEGSKAIPQKHDQSPVPPGSAQSVGDMKVLPPATPLAPSPGQQAALTAGSVPVKKMQPSPDLKPANTSPFPSSRSEALKASPQQNQQPLH